MMNPNKTDGGQVSLCLRCSRTDEHTHKPIPGCSQCPRTDPHTHPRSQWVKFKTERRPK